MDLKLVQAKKGVHVLDARGNEVAIITAKGRSLEVASDRLVGDGTAAGPFTKSVEMGQTRDGRPRIRIRFKS